MDLCGPPDLTIGLGFKRYVYASSTDNILTVMRDGGDPNPRLFSATNDAFDVFPSNVQMGFAARELSTVRNREWQPQTVLELIEADYDYILADCPHVQNIISDIALLACRRVLIPVQLPLIHEHSVDILMDHIASLTKSFDVKIEILGVVPMAHASSEEQRQFLGFLCEQDPPRLAPAPRPRGAVIASAYRAGHSIFSFIPRAKHHKKAQRESQADYLALANFILEKNGGTTEIMDNTLSQNDRAATPGPP